MLQKSTFFCFEHTFLCLSGIEVWKFERSLYIQLLIKFTNSILYRLNAATSLAQRYDLIFITGEKIFPITINIRTGMGKCFERSKIFVANAYLELGKIKMDINIYNSIHLEKTKFPVLAILYIYYLIKISFN
jgi:hypothetical protein